MRDSSSVADSAVQFTGARASALNWSLGSARVTYSVTVPSLTVWNFWPMLHDTEEKGMAFHNFCDHHYNVRILI